MPGTIYLHLLISCAIWSQGIIGTFADEDIKTRNSSDFLVRQKRVISYEQGGARIERIEDQPHIVHIKRSTHVICVGSILSHRIVITTAQCAEFPPTEYKVLSNSASLYHGISHNVTDIEVHMGNIHGRDLDGIALFTIDPAIVYGIFVKNIGLHVGPLLPGVLGTVSGWGYNAKNKATGPGTNYPMNLRSIQVPIMAHQECVHHYRNYYPITEKDICTFHPLRHCGHNDGGAPLVIDNLLVGIFLRRGPLGFRRPNSEYPEVFALLQHTYYSDWIRAKITIN